MIKHLLDGDLVRWHPLFPSAPRALPGIVPKHVAAIPTLMDAYATCAVDRMRKKEGSNIG